MIYLSLGSNIGDRLANLRAAVRQLQKISSSALKISSVYQTEPLGYTDQPDFYNLVIALDCNLTARELLAKTAAIELDLGRKRDFVNCPRTIDIDIIAYHSEEINQADLTVPHPRFKDRQFVLQPLAQICPDFIDPASKKNIQMLIKSCSDQSKLKIVGEL